MNFRFRALIFTCWLSAFWLVSSNAAVIFKPGERAKYVAPGEEEISGNAEQLFHTAQEAEQKNNLKRAIGAYRALAKRYPKDALAPGSVFKAAELHEKLHEYLGAAEMYRWLMERYPSDLHFNESIEGLFRIGELYLNGRKVRVFGISVANALDKAVDIFASIIRTAPYGKYTARAQFDIGLAREKDGANDAAIQAYQAVVDKFPNDPVAADAQYQIGYIWFTASKGGTKDFAATEKSKVAFQDFLFRFPNSEKSPQARANLNILQKKTTSTAFTIAKYYDKQKAYRAAVIYYNEVIRTQPGSAESTQAQKRIDQLRAKVGEAAIQPLKAEEEAAAAKKKANEKSSATAKNAPGMRGSPNDVAPLPPSDTDPALPPPASLMPDNTTAPASALSVDPSASSPDASAASSDTTAAPESSASPAP